MVDGARNALLGYLYQLLGTAELVCLEQIPEGDDAIACLVARVRNGMVCCEEFGQDATIIPAATPKQGITAIQFKHSLTPTKQIDSGEFIDILNGFHNSREWAAKRTLQVDFFTLITNRPLSPDAYNILDSKFGLVAHPKLLLTVKKGRPTAATKRRLQPHGSNPSIAAQAWHTVVRRLDVIQNTRFEDGVSRLRKFAATYGVLDEEWLEARTKLGFYEGS